MSAPLLGGLCLLISLTEAVEPEPQYRQHEPYLSASENANMLLEDMQKAIDQSQALTFTIKAWERFEGKMHFTENDVRMQVNPFRIHLKMRSPDKGVEVLFSEGQRNGMALVHPAGFPYVNVKLDPYGSRMRKGQHHTIFESGFGYLGSIIRENRTSYANEQNWAEVSEGHMITGRSCTMVTLHNRGYGWIDYSPAAGETLLSLGRKRFLPEYVILERNSSVEDFGKLSPGKSIRIPNNYASKVVLYLDNQSKLPIQQEIYDDQGLFEKYLYERINQQPDFAENEFQANCPRYGF